MASPVNGKGLLHGTHVPPLYGYRGKPCVGPRVLRALVVRHSCAVVLPARRQAGPSVQQTAQRCAAGGRCTTYNTLTHRSSPTSAVTVHAHGCLSRIRAEYTHLSVCRTAVKPTRNRATRQHHMSTAPVSQPRRPCAGVRRDQVGAVLPAAHVGARDRPGVLVGPSLPARSPCFHSD
jgi:hypothetical protein